MPSIRSCIALSLTLLSTFALARPTTGCHGDSGVRAVGETRGQAAGLARDLIKNTGVGTLMSIMNAEQHGGVVEGYPFGSMDYYVDDCDDSGTPLMLLSHLQINVQNARTRNAVSLAVRKLPAPGERGNPMVDPRVTLMGRLVDVPADKQAKAEACFVAKHPEAKWWLPGAGFHDFKWYTLDIQEMYYIGGFGGIHYIGWIDVDAYYQSRPRIASRPKSDEEIYSFLAQRDISQDAF
ncbi:hypothetical protein BGW38_003858 [Lunasporangiospora selenospora]|uniref:CREG-like beta-barrel domain-containing protein n=1 Tax=Lunasporangiospora selenospora TaxID=979761 RepID=A0A9P6KCE8_9FUNG|nr:hypothetical protein BGW38_003858 [Lunasporangiospora selenospora]